MKRRADLPELLAPAGDFSALVAAVKGGADAVYIGGKSFSARAFAKNFDIDEIREAVRYCRAHGVKLYVTLNTLIFDKELSGALAYAAELYRAGVDALIAADVGLISLVRRYIPDFEIHASTQMSVHNSLGADEAARLGCSRVVLARELSGADIAAVTAACSVETEVFLHGALCVCHSGQCLFSSLVGGRSGNRGECAQPCRLPYNGGKYPLSLRDLSLAEHIPELISSGVASLKIEGRMKSPDYVYRVTKIYRRLLDERRRATDEEISELARIFSRGGFTDGYFRAKLGEKMTGTRSEADKNSTRSLGEEKFVPEKVKITAQARVKADEPVALSLKLGERSVTVVGEVPSAAISSPLTENDLSARLSKMGNTPFSLAPEDIAVELEGGLNLAPSAINELRRRAVDELLSAERELPVLPEYCARRRQPPRRLRSAQMMSADEAQAFAERFPDEAKYFDMIFIPLFSAGEEVSKFNEKIGVYLPPIIMENEIEIVRKKLADAKKRGIMYTLVCNIGHFDLAKEFDFHLVGDFRLNVMNSESAELYRRAGAELLVSSPELSAPAARDVAEGAIVYGRVPLMITERCFIKENFGCAACGKTALTDRRGFKFPMLREWEHRNLILNSVVTYMADKEGELEKNSINHRHFIFTTESSADIASVVRAYKKRAAAKDARAIRRMGMAVSKESKK